MWDLFIASENLPFSIALTLMVGIAILEGVTTILGVAVSELVDAMVPEFDADIDVDLDVDADADLDLGVDGTDGADSVPALSQFLGWLRVGQVPVLILFILFLLSFGLGGMFTQSAVESLTGGYLPAWLASIPA